MEELQRLFTPVELESLRAESPVPLYHQLYQLLKQRILGGEPGYGEKLPTEAQLAEGFSVSRVTAKRALDLLVANELIERKRGRGSHVVFQAPASDVEAPLVGMLEKLAHMSRSTRVRVLHIDRRPPPANLVEELDIPAGEPVHYVVRVRYREDHTPFAYYESWTRGIEHGFDAEAIESRLRFDIMAENGHRIARIEQHLSAAAAAAPVAEQLRLEPGDPVLTLVRYSFDSEGDLVDLLHCKYHTGHFHYRMNLSMEDYTRE